MRILLVLSIVLLTFHAKAEPINYHDISKLECGAINAIGVSKMVYIAEMGFLMAYTGSVMGPSMQIYAINNVEEATSFAGTDYQIGKITFISANQSNPLKYKLVTADPIIRGEYVYGATWGYEIPSPSIFIPPVFMPIAETICTIAVRD